MLRGKGGATAAFAMDVADREAVERCAGRLRAEGERVDVLVNNAAIYPGDTLLSTPAEVLQRTLETNWVRTRMGGGGATRSVEQGADTIVWLATLDHDGPNGGFFRDRKRIEW